jgi:large repetitive protein
MTRKRLLSTPNAKHWRTLVSVIVWYVMAGVASAAELSIGEGVVIKLGDGAELIIRDRVQIERNVTLTSARDDATGGPLSSTTSQPPAAGSWRGFRIERSATLLGGPVEGLSIRYAGIDGGAAMGLRISSSFVGLRVTDNVAGLRVSDGADATFSGLNARENQVAVEFQGNATGTITTSSFSGNAGHAVLNRTPANPITATGNWWGHATGPRDSAGNPAGQGDPVSSGVAYGAFLAAAPLVAPSVRLADGVLAFVETPSVRLELQCGNAVDFRIAEGAAFSGISFAALNGERAVIDFPLSPNDGLKSISAQFRSASGEIVTVALPGGLLVDRLPPQVEIKTPAPASVVNETVNIEVDASDGTGIQKVEIFVDGVLAATRTATPYTFAWNTTAVAEGNRELRAVATDNAGRTTSAINVVTVARVVLPPDTEGPTIANARIGGVPLVNGLVLSRPTTLTVDAADRSGVARVEATVDGGAPLVATGSGPYSITLGAPVLTNGDRVLVLRAFDSLNNVSSATYNVTVARAGPEAPRITQPAVNISTRDALLAIAGLTQPSASVQVFVNGTPIGGALTAAPDGSFGSTLTLAPGPNELRARATDAFGTSDPSAPVLVTLDVTVPTAPTNLIAHPLAAGRIRLTWSPTTDASVVGYLVYRATVSFNAVTEATRVNSNTIVGGVLEDMPTSDGTYFYRVVAVNGSGTHSPPTNLVSANADNTPPTAAVSLTPLGKIDGATGHVGQGRVNVVLTLSEAVQGTPYLAVVPQGGSPITVDLVRTEETRFTGSFLINPDTPSGAANLLFSARDLVGNRGTAITAGASLGIDTEGPTLSSASLTPGAPIRNDTAQTVTAVFTFSEPIKTGEPPVIRYLLSGPARAPAAVTGLTLLSPTTWGGSFTLPADAGAGGPELLSFSHQSKDNIDNLSTRVAGANRYQIYQGDLPPVAVPFGLTAVARPLGKVELAWQSVAEAEAYQIYRQGPADALPQPLPRVAGTELTDQTPIDGEYSYAVASVRRANNDESLSGASAAVTVRSSRLAPGAPQNLVLQLSGTGIQATWQAPLNSTVASYNIYRAATTTITAIDGLSPLRGNIRSPAFVDADPSPTAAAYVVTALDEAGNESAISNSAYLNAELLPVGNLQVEQIGNALPTLTWTASRRGAVGYNVYVGPEASRIKLNTGLLTQLNFTDTGFTSGERRYTVSAVDANDVELARSVVLPAISAQLAGGLPIKRGIMNRVLVQITNTSAASVEQARVIIRAAEVDHKSELLALAPNETRMVPVIVGGYDTLTSSSPLVVGIESVPNEGELIRVARSTTAEVIDGALVVGLTTDAFVRGGTGKVRLSVENTSEVDIELLTATSNGQGPSNELRFRLTDVDGNVLATQPYQQVFGASVVTLTSGQTVARIPAGARYASDEFAVNVPAAAPDRVRLQLEVDRLRYRTGTPEALSVKGRGSEMAVSLVDTVYVGEVTDVSPVSSFGDQDVVISGRALDRRTSALLPNTRLRLLLNQEGFERVFSVVTGTDGTFSYVFKPTLTDSGIYRVAAVHPEITSRPEQRSFAINRIKASPTPYALEVPRNYAFAIPLQLTGGIGTTASNVRFVLNAASQPTGALPPGVSLVLPAPVALASRQTLNARSRSQQTPTRRRPARSSWTSWLIALVTIQ